MEAKIYTIESLDKTTGEIKLYVGSTEDWKNRYDKHNSDFTCNSSRAYNYKLYKHLRDNNNSLVMNEIDSCLINEKYIWEQEWMDRLCPDLNNQRAYNSDEYKQEYNRQYRNINKEILTQKNKVWRDNNKVVLSKKSKERYINNRSKLLKQFKQYGIDNKIKIATRRKEHYEANKERLLAEKAQPITCECGAIVRRAYLTRHKKTTKHNKLFNI